MSILSLFLVVYVFCFEYIIVQIYRKNLILKYIFALAAIPNSSYVYCFFFYEIVYAVVKDYDISVGRGVGVLVIL